MYRYLYISEIVDSVSITHKFDKEKLIFLNTSDILEGNILNKNLMKVSDLKGQAKKTIHNGDILFSEIRPKNKRFAKVKVENPADYVVSTKLMVLRKFNDDVDLDYLYYCLTNDNMLTALQNRAENRICSFPQITFDLLSEYKLRIPSLDEQKRVSSFLSNIDSKIELNTKINQELELLAKTLYDYWFFQFEFPDKKGKPYKSSGGKIVWSEELKREIPEGWEVKKLEEIEKNIITGKTPSTECSEYFNGDIPFITIGDIRGNTYIIDSEIKLTEKGANTQENKYIPEGSICVSCIATPGLVGFTSKKSQTNQQINSVICKNEENKIFLYFAIKDYFKFSSGAKTGNTFANMNKGDFSNIKLLYPTEEILKKYYELSCNIFTQILSISKQNHELRNLKDFILPMLMNGQVTFKSEEELNTINLRKNL